MLENRCIQRNKCGKAPDNQGFTLMEMIIVIAIIAVLIGLAAVGMSGYYRTSDQMRRAEVAETAFYSLQSHVNYLERQGNLPQFHGQILSYNRTVYGQDNILSEAQNRTIIELNYGGENAASFYADEYYPDHRDSQIVYIRLDKEQNKREENPVYDILAASLQDEDVMEGSFLIEYDMSTGVVRGVFYSEDAGTLAYHFAGDTAAATGDATDCILRDAGSLYGKRQGFYGLTYTAAGYATEVYEMGSLFLPDKLELVNGDRLYLTWREANTENPSFTDGTFQMEEIRYLVTLYNQDNKVIAVYNLKRGDLYSDASGTQKGMLNYLDDFVKPVSDTLSGSTKTARAGYTDLSYGDSPDGRSGQYYFLLLECLDHPFLENGYDFLGSDTIHASVSIAYGGGNLPGGEESVASNTESAFYAHVENGEGDAEYGIGCARHLWNIRNGYHDGDYRLVEDIDWADIEGRARDISFTSTQFADRETMGLYHSFTGTFTGEKPEEEAFGLYSHYRINGLSIREEGTGRVGLFTINMGSISKVVFTGSWVKGTTEVGTAAGLNQGSIDDVCVLEGTVTGESRVGGLTGSNEGTITGCTVTTGNHLISAYHTVGGVAGYAAGTIMDSRAACRVEAVIPEGTEKISQSLTGRYVGGVIGYLEKGVTAENLYSGVLLDGENGMPLAESEAGRAGSVRACSLVTGIQYVGGVIGDIEKGAGTYTKLYNYASLGVTYVSEEERAQRNDANTRMYQYYGGITGMVHEGNGLTGCINYAPVAVTFVKDGKPMEEDLYAYIDNYPANNNYWNMPWYIGGITGTNKGTVTDCYSLCSEYESFAVEAESYYKVFMRQENSYVGCVVGGLIGSNEGILLFTADLPVDTLQTVVKAFIGSCGGIVGSATGKGVIRNEKGPLKVQGVVELQGNVRPQNNMDYVGGIAGRITGSEFTGVYINDAYVMGKTAGGITGRLEKGVTLESCVNTGIVYGRGNEYTSLTGAAGGIAAFNYGILKDCTNTGTVTTDKAISDIPAINGTTDTYAGKYGGVGGVAGYNAGLVQNCHSRLNADGSNFVVASNLCATGGFVGVNAYDGKTLFGEITHDGVETVDIPIVIGGAKKFNYGTKVGGIIGAVTGSLDLRDFTYSGKIEVRCAQGQFSPGVGGIAGSMGVGASLTGCTMSGEISSKTYDTGGLVGYMAGGVIDDTNQVTKEAVIKGVTNTGGVVGYHYVSDASSHIDIMENKATVSGTSYVGGLAGYVDVGGTFDLSGRKNSGSVSGVQYVGGLAGGYRFTKLTEITDCENTGEVTGKTGVGGIAGYILSPDKGIDHTLYHAVNRGRVLANQADSSSVGGIVGYCTCPLTIKECRNEGEIGLAEETCSLSYAGGIMGRGNNSFHIQSCSNMANVIGTSYVGGIVGCITQTGETVTFSDCVNEAGTRLVATRSAVGGILGMAGATSAKNGKLEMQRCVNYGFLDTPNYVGGINGYTSYVVLQVEECHNYGEIGAYSAGRWQVTNAGGIIGWANGGKNLAESRIENCTQNANIREVGNIKSSGSSSITCCAGGIAGSVGVPMVIQDCFYGSADKKYTVSSAGDMGTVGGIVGSCGYTSTRMKLVNCDNYADFYAAGKMSEAGGLVGCARTNLVVGEDAQEATYCHSYGNIDAEGVMDRVGGIVGVAANTDFSIYGSDFYGLIGKGAPSTNSVGGLIGYINSSIKAQGTLKDCTQHGQIYHGVNYVGGLVGYHSGLSLHLENSKNGVEGEDGSGDIFLQNPSQAGGLIGYSGIARTDSEKVMLGCHNYGDILMEGTANYVGGLIGYDKAPTTIGDENDESLSCDNYGDIRGNGTTVAECIGGVIGYADATGRLYMYHTENHGSVGEEIAKVTSLGGIAGRVAASGEMISCANYVDIVCPGEVNYLGGIAGQSQRMKYGREADSLLGCINYGSLCGEGTENGLGGIVGYIYGPSEAYYCKNEGEIAKGNGSLCQSIGGIAGRVSANHCILYGCENEGNVAVEGAGESAARKYQAGGIAGYFRGNYMEEFRIEACVNRGQIANPDSNHEIDEYLGGIAGYGAGTIKDCTNLGKIYGASYSGGIVGGVGEQVNKYFIIGCVNGSETDAGAGEIELLGNADYVGGILGWDQNRDSSKDCVITGCINYANIVAKAENTNNYLGGIVGIKRNLNAFSIANLEISYCENHGSILNGNDYVGGIAGAIPQTGNVRYVVANCVNYGNITGAPGDNQNGTNGGIFGLLGSPTGGVINCINVGNVSNIFASNGGLCGRFKAGYFVNNYHLGHVTAGTSPKGDLMGYVDGSGFILDVYSAYKDCADWYGGVYFTNNIINNHTGWQSGSPYLGGLTLSQALQRTEKYEYVPQSVPEGEKFQFYPANPNSASANLRVPHFTFSTKSGDFYLTSGMELWLYEDTMSDADILADESGSQAFFHTKISFGGNALPAQITVNMKESQLPATETTYKVVLKTLGHDLVLYDGSLIASTGDTDRVVQAQTITLLPSPAAAASFSGRSVSDGDAEVEDVSGGNSVSGGDSVSDGDSVSGGDKESGNVSVSGNGSSSENVSVSGGDNMPEENGTSGGDKRLDM